VHPLASEAPKPLSIPPSTANPNLEVMPIVAQRSTLILKRLTKKLPNKAPYCHTANLKTYPVV
jgi:hypothetical protein